MSQISEELKSDLEEAKALRLPWWGVLSWMCGIAPIVFLLNHFGRLDLALPILGSVAAIGLAVALKWRHRQHAWFWITIAIIAAAHGLLIVSVSWTTKWVPWIVTAGIASVDFCAILAILLIVGRFLDVPDGSRQA